MTRRTRPGPPTDAKRRSLLKGAAGILATGMFPAVHAQEKVVLRYLGTAVNQDKAIADKFKADTGIEIQYVPVNTDEVTKRAVTSPNSFDLLDTEYFSLKKIMPTGNLKGIDTKRIKNADKITTLFTTGEVGGKTIGDQGTAPKKVIFLEGEKSKTFATAPTQWMTLIPTVYNADTLGIRPDLIKRPIDIWTELLNPEFKGKAAILNIPSIGIMDAAMVVEADGPLQVPRQGQHDQEGDRPDDQDADRGQEGGPVPRVLEGLQRERQPDGLGRGGDPVDVVAGGHRGALKGIACTYQPLKEGYRAWAAGFGLPATLSGKKLDARLRLHQLVPRRLGRRLPQPPGLLLAPCSRPRRPRWSPTSGPTGWKASRRRRTSSRPTASCSRRPAAMRDGGSYEQRMGGIACWNAVMDENTYMVQKWNEFVAA